MNVVTATKSNNTITVLVNDNGVIRQIPATSDHPKWTDILKAWTEQNHAALLELLSMKRIVEKFTNGGLVVSDNGVFFKDVPLTGIDVDRLMAFMRQGEPYEPIANYMIRKLANPSRRAINEMYNFLEHKNMPLTPEGKIIAYKGVQKDFFSVSNGKEPLLQGRRNEAGQIFNGVGETIEMSRSDVDDDFRQGCSTGLHAGSLDYAKDWARSCHGIIILIEIDPADVVSVPSDCECKKLRCNKYKVIGVYDGPLPDTYTADYSTETDETEDDGYTCPNCGEEECSCDNEICDGCGEDVNECTCERCERCDELLDNCTCDTTPDCQCGTCTGNEGAGDMDHIVPRSLGGAENMDNVVEVPKDVNANKGVITREKETVRDQLGLNEPLSEDQALRQKFVAEVCEQLGCRPEDVTDDKNFVEDLGADSLDTVELAMGLEDKFGVEIPDEVAEQCETVGKAIAALKNLIHPQPAPVNPLKVMQDNLDNVLEAVEKNEKDVDTYQRGYQLGLRNGIRRRARLYHQGDENCASKVADPIEFIRGYNDGYRAGRKDYKH